jgi:antitoxin component YwqK of YwqJK toxin-antitoxin module
MPIKKQSPKKRIVHHKDGTVWAKGLMAGEEMAGYWEWFRKDGTKMRSGHFENGEQAGEWITYDKKGKVYKVTNFKPKVNKSGPVKRGE